MKFWSNEYVFDHSWETIVQSQWRKYPNPHNTAVIGTDVVDRNVTADGKLHSKRVITSDWGLAPWVQSLIGANRDTFAYEHSVVDPVGRTMDLTTTNLTFCNFVSMREKLRYAPHPDDPSGRTLMTTEMVVTVRGVPLTSYMESIILNTVSSNAGKGRKAMNWVVEKFDGRRESLSDSLDRLKLELAGLGHLVSDSDVIATALKSVEELQGRVHAPIVNAAEDCA